MFITWKTSSWRAWISVANPFLPMHPAAIASRMQQNINQTNKKKIQSHQTQPSPKKLQLKFSQRKRDLLIFRNTRFTRVFIVVFYGFPLGCKKRENLGKNILYAWNYRWKILIRSFGSLICQCRIVLYCKLTAILLNLST